MVHAPTDPPEFSEGGAIDLQPALEVLLNGGVLNRTQAEQAFEAMMSGSVHHGEMGALLALLAARQPDPEEVAGATSVMRRHVTAGRTQAWVGWFDLRWVKRGSAGNRIRSWAQQ